jgi:hypothetical protein
MSLNHMIVFIDVQNAKHQVMDTWRSYKYFSGLETWYDTNFVMLFAVCIAVILFV